MEQPLVSIIIPFYNSEQFLKRCIGSVLKQNTKNIEVICVDDGSTDQSCEKIQEFTSHDRRIKVYKNGQRRGQSYARNRGLEHASGKYVWFVDSDDYIRENVLGELITVADNDNLDILRINFRYGELQAGKKSDLYPEELTEEVVTGKRLFTDLVQANILVATVWQNFVKKDFLLEHNIRFVENIYCEDMLYTYELMRHAKRCLCNNQLNYIYCVRANSTSTGSVNDQHILGCLVTITEILQRMSNDCSQPAFLYASYSYIKKLHDNMFRSLCRMNRSIDSTNWNLNLRQFYESAVKTLSFIDLEVVNDNHDRICSAAPVYIFGAGEACKQLIQILYEKNVCVRGIIVSSLDNNPGELLGYKVYEYLDAGIDRSRLVLIALTEKYKDEAISLLQQNKYTNVLYTG